jgi:hypothetical protein
MTETILHGYQFIILPRQNGAYEVVITTPESTTERYTHHGLKRRIGQLQRELEVMLKAQEMLIAVRTSGVLNSLKQDNNLSVE